MVLNLRDTGNTWFTCKPAAQELCTAGNATINYLFDCARVSAAIMATEKTPLSAPVGDGGINEHGSHHCHNAGGALSALRGVIESLNNDTMVLTGEQIACYQNNICIWYQGDAVGTLKQTKDLLQTLASYGVQDCGSIPVRYAEGSNEVSYGMLTADTNSDPCCYAYSLQETCVCPHFQ